MALIDDVKGFAPPCDQEAEDKEMFLEALERDPGAFGRDSVAHFTASAWCVDEAGEHTLLVYHNIYDSWSWVGGHADGEKALSAVAARELAEETGVEGARMATRGLGPGSILSIEALPVAGHLKRGRYVSSHVHLNVTYLFVADANAPLRSKPDENSGVRWVPLDDVVALSSEPWMCEHVYGKLIERTRQLAARSS